MDLESSGQPRTVMFLLRLAAVLSAGVALAAAMPAIRRRRWNAFWPVPVMVFAAGLGILDAVSLVKGTSDLSAASLILGVLAAGVVIVFGAMEISACRRGVLDARALVAPALLVASGILVLLQAPAIELTVGWVRLTSGLAIVLAGIVLAVGWLRPSHETFWGYRWAAALFLGTVLWSAPSRSPFDPYADAKQEVAALLEAWTLNGHRVTHAGSIPVGRSASRAPIELYRVDSNEVRVYFVAHDTAGAPEDHLWPRVPVPPPADGVPHTHYGPHILVVCLTGDLRFARQLDALVRGLGDRGRGAPGGSRGTTALSSWHASGPRNGHS